MDEPTTDGDSTENGRSRRAFMSDTALASGGALALSVAGVGVEVEGSAVAEYFARPTLQYSTYQQIQDVRDHEEAHVDALSQTIEDLGGTPVEPAEYEFPYSSIEEFVAIADRLEAVGVSAYAGVAPMIDSDEVLEAALSIHSVEAEHQTYFQLLHLQRPSPDAFNMARSMDEVLPIAKQFIVGAGNGDDGDAGGNGLVTAESDASVPATVERIKQRIQNKGLTLVTTVDHAANAASVGMELPPTTFLVFGNPNVGTPLMQASQTIGIDLPQKMLVYEEDGRTNVVYNSPQYLAARHDITGQDERLQKIGTVLATVAGGDVDRSGADPSALLDSGNGLVTVTGGESVEATVGRIQDTLESKQAISLVTTVDHAANADSVGMELRPTTLLVFGNPKLGTPLMQASRITGIDLPQKLLVYEDGGGAVRVAYNDPQYLAERHGIAGRSDLLAKIENALRSIASGQ